MKIKKLKFIIHRKRYQMALIRCRGLPLYFYLRKLERSIYRQNRISANFLGIQFNSDFKLLSWDNRFTYFVIVRGGLDLITRDIIKYFYKLMDKARIFKCLIREFKEDLPQKIAFAEEFNREIEGVKQDSPEFSKALDKIEKKFKYTFTQTKL